MRAKILVVEDDKFKRDTIEDHLQSEGFEARSAANAYEGENLLEEADFDVVVTDLKMPGKDGLEFLKEIRSKWPGTSVIIMTAHGSVENAVEAMKNGARDYLSKPFGLDELLLKLNIIVKQRELEKELLSMRKTIQSQFGLENLIARSSQMRKLADQIKIIADDDCTVLIEGETGTGKEMVANSIHYNSRRRNNPLIKVSCALLSREVMESELLGHEKGAFTGADRQKTGRFELANKGTLFLDEIDDVPLDLQVKLLRFLQEKQIERVGGEKTFSLDIRVVCATKADLSELVDRGKFREDLYYRLNVAHFEIPPLRERKDDITPLTSFFLKKYSEIKGKPYVNVSSEVIDLLMGHGWPGNVRELENAIERALAFCASDIVRVSDLPEYLCRGQGDNKPFSLMLEGRSSLNLPAIIQQMESELIEWSLKIADGNQQRAADNLGIPRTTLRQKMAKLKDAK